MSVVAVYATFADVDEALRIGRIVVEERLAACINVLAPCTSIYQWQGSVEQADEAPALLKTTVERVDALIARVAELHSYDVPAVAAWPIAHLPASFGEWVQSELR